MASHLEKELGKQLSLLALACQAFDRGLRPIARHIALSLRVLLHQRGQSRALLHELGHLSHPFFASGRHLNPRNLLTECALCFVRLKVGDGAAGGFEPFLDDGPVGQARWLPFEEWWTETIAKNKSGRRFTRRELVGHLAEADGGGRVDPLLDAAYMALSRENSLGWTLTTDDGSLPLGGPEVGCVRQIAHELLETLKAARVASARNL
jgi:hypothetical protein